MDANEYSIASSNIYFTYVYISEEICAVYASNAFVALYHKLPDDILAVIVSFMRLEEDIWQKVTQMREKKRCLHMELIHKSMGRRRFRAGHNHKRFDLKYSKSLYHIYGCDGDLCNFATSHILRYGLPMRAVLRTL